MRKQLRVFLIFAAFCFFLNASAQARGPAAKAALAPDFTLLDLNNNSATLSAYKGKSALILFFWATWCPFCRAELKVLAERKDQLAKEGWELFIIDIGESESRVAAYMKKYAPSLNVLLDKDSKVAESYELVGVPTYVIIDKQGNEVFKDNYFPDKEFRSSILK